MWTLGEKHNFPNSDKIDINTTFVSDNLTYGQFKSYRWSGGTQLSVNGIQEWFPNFLKFVRWTAVRFCEFKVPNYISSPQTVWGLWVLTIQNNCVLLKTYKLMFISCCQNIFEQIFHRVSHFVSSGYTA